MFSDLIEGRIKSTEMNQIATALKRQHCTTIVYNSPLAKRGSFFAPDENVIHFQGGAAQQRRGLFYEEIQHAFDHHAGVYEGISNNFKLHSVTARKLVDNPLLPTTSEQNARLLKLADDWK